MDFARKAVAEFSANGKADFSDKVAARLNLAQALCHMKECPSAIPVLKETVAMAKLAFRANDFPVGEAEFLLGFAYWRSGEMAGASEYMERGTTMMKAQLGWGHPTYLSALGKYAQFLSENRRGEEAKVVRGEIRRAEAVVDVRSLQASAFSFGGLR